MKRNSRRSTDKRRPPIGTPDARVILGVDPGSLTTGYGVVMKDGTGKVRLIASGAIRNSPDHSIPERLHKIHCGLLDVIREFAPTEFAIESSFYGKNAQSALKLGQVRGVALLAAVISGLPCHEYTPREVKQSVVGNGAAGKYQVRYMVRSLLGLGDRPLVLDTSDAMAVALCHLNRKVSPRPGVSRTWKSYIDAHPEKVLR